MGIYRLKAELVVEALGLGDEAGGDETAISTINVRLDQMFREVVRNYDNLIIVHSEDLERLRGWSPAWAKEAKKFTTPRYIYRRDEPQLNELMRSINQAPVSLAHEIGQSERLTFCQTPQFWWRREGNEYGVCVWMHAITEIHGGTKHEGSTGQAVLDHHD